MKKTTLLVAACLSSAFGMAQKLKDTEVPVPVKTAFTREFPKAKDIKWSRESADEIEAEFKSNGSEMSANFTNAGVWTVTETEIKKADLPKTVQDAIAKEFPGYKIEEAEKAETPGNQIAYDTKLEKGGNKWEVKFSPDGIVLKKEAKKEKDKKKD